MNSAGRPRRRGPLERSAAAFVISHGAQENHAVSQPVSVYREIEGRSAKPRRIGKYIPQYFANAEDCHLILKKQAYHSDRVRATPPGSHRNHKNFRLALSAPFQYAVVVGRFVHADSSQSIKTKTEEDCEQQVSAASCRVRGDRVSMHSLPVAIPGNFHTQRRTSKRRTVPISRILGRTGRPESSQ